jgi:hypothetical protein
MKLFFAIRLFACFMLTLADDKQLRPPPSPKKGQKTHCDTTAKSPTTIKVRFASELLKYERHDQREKPAMCRHIGNAGIAKPGEEEPTELGLDKDLRSKFFLPLGDRVSAKDLRAFIEDVRIYMWGAPVNVPCDEVSRTLDLLMKECNKFVDGQWRTGGTAWLGELRGNVSNTTISTSQ